MFWVVLVLACLLVAVLVLGLVGLRLWRVGKALLHELDGLTADLDAATARLDGGGPAAAHLHTRPTSG